MTKSAHNGLGQISWVWEISLNILNPNRVYPELRPGELRPDNSGRLIQARPNSGPAIPIQAGPNSGPSHLRPASPNSGQCHFRPAQLRPVPTQAKLSHFRPISIQVHPISGWYHFRPIPIQAELS